MSMGRDATFGGADLVVDEALRGVLALGVLEAAEVAHPALPPEFDAEVAQVSARWTGFAQGRPPADIPGVAEVRALFHALDIDPTKTRPSSEALLRRILQGRGLPRVDPVVDVCNLCSLEHQLPFGLYDRAQVRGVAHARLGRAGEGYEGIRKDHVNVAERLVLADDDGPFGAPTSDSLRTAVTPGTSQVLVVVYCPNDRADADLSVALESIAARLTRWCSASVLAVRVLR
jgi:DNA/RNA-binding domain of Phe-tRNA-synthetase-like protein